MGRERQVEMSRGQRDEFYAGVKLSYIGTDWLISFCLSCVGSDRLFVHVDHAAVATKWRACKILTAVVGGRSARRMCCGVTSRTVLYLVYVHVRTCAGLLVARARSS